MTVESSQPTVADSSDNTAMALSPPNVLGATQPIVGAQIRAATAQTPTILYAYAEQPILMLLPHDYATVSTVVRLEGFASDGREVEIFDGKDSMGIVTAENRKWTIRISGLRLGPHTFIARILPTLVGM
jgi:hypothetical protein